MGRLENHISKDQQIQRQNNIINRTIIAISSCTDIPIEFIESGMYCILAETIGDRFRLSGTLGKNKLLNLFNIIGSPPHMAHRSDLIGYMTFIVETAITAYHKRIDENGDKDKLDNDIEAHTLQAGGSTEGLIDKIEELYEKGIRSFLVIDPEIGKTFDAMNVKGSHMSGTTDTLCRLFTRDAYANYYSQKTKDKNTKIVRKLPTDISFSILGAMQNPEHYLTGKTAKVGMLRRLWITAVRGKGLPPYMPLITPNRNKDEMYMELKSIGLEIGRMMVEFKNSKYHSIVLEWGEGVVEKINEFDKEYVMYARENDDDTVALAKITFGEMCCKLAGIKTISEHRIKIELNDVETAKNLLVKSSEQTDISLRNIEQTEEQKWMNKQYEKFVTYIEEGLDLRTIQQRFSANYCNPVRGTDFKKVLAEILVEYKNIGKGKLVKK